MGSLFGIGKAQHFKKISNGAVKNIAGINGAKVSAYKNKRNNIFVVSSCGNKALDAMIAAGLYENSARKRACRYGKNAYQIKFFNLFDNEKSNRDKFRSNMASKHFSNKDWIQVSTFDENFKDGIVETIISPHKKGAELAPMDETILMRKSWDIQPRASVSLLMDLIILSILGKSIKLILLL